MKSDNSSGHGVVEPSLMALSMSSFEAIPCYSSGRRTGKPCRGGWRGIRGVFAQNGCLPRDCRRTPGLDCLIRCDQGLHYLHQLHHRHRAESAAHNWAGLFVTMAMSRMDRQECWWPGCVRRTNLSSLEIFFFSAMFSIAASITRSRR